MRAFLVVPQCLSPKQTYREYPLGVGLIATALRRGGHEVAIYDQAAEGGDDEALLARMGQFRPDVAGFSLVTPSYPVARRQMARLKAQWPDLPVLAGGIHANLFPEDLLADGADAVVLGQGQAVMPRLLERLDRREAWGELPGLVFRDGRGDCVRTAPQAPASAAATAERDAAGAAGAAGAEDPDVIDRDVYNLPLYTHHSMLASLGCPFSCAFCCNFSGTVLHGGGAAGGGGGVIVRPAERVLDEMEYLVSRYQAEKIFFADDVFLLTRANILAFCRQLRQRKLSVQWIAQMRVDALDAQVAAAMAEAGCGRIYFGVESGSDAILRRVRKALTCEAIRQGIAHAKAAGMRVKTGWIFGLPGSLAEQYETLPLLREIRPHEVSIHQLIPFPGTDYYNHPAEHGIRIRDPKDFESFCYGGLGDNVSFDYLPRAQLMELLERAAAMLESEGYVASDRATGGEEYVYSTPLSAVSMTVFRGPAGPAR